jgi:hypothetical protein
MDVNGVCNARAGLSHADRALSWLQIYIRVEAALMLNGLFVSRLR